MRSFIPLLAALLLAGCSSRLGQSLESTPNSGPCPAGGSIYDAARVVTFGPGGQEDFSNVAFTGEIIDVRLYCRYTGATPLLAEVEIDFAFGKGPAASGSAYDYPYFVAVTRRNGKVLAKERFTVTGEFQRGLVDGATETITRIEVPRLDESISGVNFEILVGFELTDEQLAYNRAGKRFRLDAAN